MMGINWRNLTQLFAALLALLLLVLALSWKVLRDRRRHQQPPRVECGARRYATVTGDAARDLVWLKDTGRCHLHFVQSNIRSRLLNASVGADRWQHRISIFTEPRWRYATGVAATSTAVRSGAAVDTEEWLTFADNGHSALIQITRTPVYGDDGRLVGIMGRGGISRRNTIKTELRRRGELPARAHRQLPFLVWLKDTDGRFLAVNALCADLRRRRRGRWWARPTWISGRELALGYQTDESCRDGLAPEEVVEQGEDAMAGRSGSRPTGPGAG